MKAPAGYTTFVGRRQEVLSPPVAEFRARPERLGRVMVPARWPVARRSAWNRALALGTVVPHVVSGPRHIGRRGYLGTVKAADGSSNVATTAAVTARLLHPGLRR